MATLAGTDGEGRLVTTNGFVVPEHYLKIAHGYATEVLQLCRNGRISWADMVLAPAVAGLFKWRQFEPEVILLAVGWYLRFSLSYRDVEELLAERGLHADHVTVWRWVQRYAPEIQRRLRPRLRATNDSWRVD